MKKIIKCFIPVLVLFFILVATPVSAKNLGTMKGISWDLKLNKPVTYYTYVGGAGYIKQKATLTRMNFISSSESGYVKLYINVNYTRQTALNAKQIHKICSYYNNSSVTFSPRCYYTVVDYSTGKSLMNSNPRGVKVDRASWVQSGSKTYKAGSDSVTIANTSMSVYILLPISYKNMCLGIGGWSKLTESTMDQSFWSGTVPFWKAKSKYSTSKKIAHFTRVRVPS